jgi:DNA helicase IV
VTFRDEVAREQEYVSALYRRLDDLRVEAAARLADAVGGMGEAGADRDAAVTEHAARLGRLDAAERGLCFGRLDLVGGDRLYLGRIGLSAPCGVDDPLLIDWRAPAARPFYAATTAAPAGVHRRRRLITRGRRVVGLDDEVLDGTISGTEQLSGDAALLAALDAGRTGRMSDIVATVQAEQDAIIRSDHRGVLVVQGGPGTGKTAVALHRAAYLLYHHPRLTRQGVLVVGPNLTFLTYIGQVLPGLEETSVRLATLADLVPGVSADRPEPAATAELKGRPVLAEVLAAAVRRRQAPGAATEPPGAATGPPGAAADPAWRRAAARAHASGLPHHGARAVFADAVVDHLARRIAERDRRLADRLEAEVADVLAAADVDAAVARDLESLGLLDRPVPDTPPDDEPELRRALAADPAVRAAIEARWPVLTPERLLTELFADPDASAACVALLTDAERALLRREPGGGWSPADVPLLDEAAELLGPADRPAEAQDRTAAFGHVIVDEAQELSPMAWRMVLRRCPARWMTLVGDVAQTSAAAGATSWAEALRPHVGDRWRLARLTVNYRTPAEIMAAAADLLAALDPDLTPPVSVRKTGVRPWRIRTSAAELPVLLARWAALEAAALDAGRLAVIGPDDRVTGLADAVRTAVPDVASGPDADLTAQVVVLGVRQAKGLEFDSVLIADPVAILAASPRGRNDLYVAMTRSTRRLGLLHPGPAPAEIARTLVRLAAS